MSGFDRPTVGENAVIQCTEPAFPCHGPDHAGVKVSDLGLVDDYIRQAESELSLGASKFQASALGLYQNRGLQSCVPLISMG